MTRRRRHSVSPSSKQPAHGSFGTNEEAPVATARDSSPPRTPPAQMDNLCSLMLQAASQLDPNEIKAQEKARGSLSEHATVKKRSSANSEAGPTRRKSGKIRKETASSHEEIKSKSSTVSPSKARGAKRNRDTENRCSTKLETQAAKRKSQPVKKRRRKSHELREDEKWRCPSGCGKFFRKTSTLSIHKHIRECEVLAKRKEFLEKMDREYERRRCYSAMSSPVNHFKFGSPQSTAASTMMLSTQVMLRRQIQRQINNRLRMKRALKNSIFSCPKIRSSIGPYHHQQQQQQQSKYYDLNLSSPQIQFQEKSTVFNVRTNRMEYALPQSQVYC
eukprot:jgi/Bigna1/89067/estExt_fgenesh1_pg.C_430044